MAVKRYALDCPKLRWPGASASWTATATQVFNSHAPSHLLP